ncbi:MAG: amino acid permease [Gammaproteobacteria bacterium]|nr:amino acid permease [Gammaproteobacteria bacterium]
MPTSRKTLTVFSLVMINVIAVDSLRTLPISAALGLSLISYYLFAAVAFFIPVALVAAELATTYPKTGGLYIWTREAFGGKVGFLTIWLQWIYNVVWYPTILAFIASTSSYLFAPDLANNPDYILITSVGLFWLFTLLNVFGMKLSSLISTIGALFGTILPMIVIISLGIAWLMSTHPTAIHLSDPILPTFHSLHELALLPGILFGLLGMEMSAVHAEEVKNPQRDYPKALLYSTVIIFGTLMFGSLAITLVVSPQHLSILSGLLDAFQIFFQACHLPWMTQVVAGLIILGALSGVSAWIIGPTKGLLAAAHDGMLPPYLAKVNRHGAPLRILLIQAVIVTILCSLFYLFDTVSASYWLLTDLSAQLALIVYILMFAAAIKLRFSAAHLPRPFRIPGPRIIMILVAGSGLLCCVFATLLGFIPPAQVQIHHVLKFELILISGIVLFMAVPWYFLSKKP